jgi:hypothetical protein
VKVALKNSTPTLSIASLIFFANISFREFLGELLRAFHFSFHYYCYLHGVHTREFNADENEKARGRERERERERERQKRNKEGKLYMKRTTRAKGSFLFIKWFL